jgi:hypothetical protein
MEAPPVHAASGPRRRARSLRRRPRSCLAANVAPGSDDVAHSRECPSVMARPPDSRARVEWPARRRSRSALPPACARRPLLPAPSTTKRRIRIKQPARAALNALTTSREIDGAPLQTASRARGMGFGEPAPALPASIPLLALAVFSVALTFDPAICGTSWLESP